MAEERANQNCYVGLAVVRNNVTVHDLPISADIGIHTHEIGRPQRLLVSAALEVVSAREDNLKETLDYNEVKVLAEELGRERIALIETFASRLAQGLLAHPKVLEADIIVRKPGAFLAGMAGTRIILRRAVTISPNGLSFISEECPLGAIPLRSGDQSISLSFRRKARSVLYDNDRPTRTTVRRSLCRAKSRQESRRAS